MLGVRYLSLVRECEFLIETLDVEIHHLETRHPLKFSNIRISATGPLRASVVAEVKLASSVVKVSVSVHHILPTPVVRVNIH